MSATSTLEAVKAYYGRVLQTNRDLKTSACCTAESLPAYLESSKERNVDFYARHGFRVTRELRLPKGPPLWSMWREPSGH